MTSEDQNFEIYAGESKVITVSVKEAGIAVNLTGATDIRWVVKRNEDDATALITKTLASGITTLDQILHAGEFTITLDPEDTEDLGGASYYHEAEVTDSAGDPSTVTRGILTIKKALT